MDKLGLKPSLETCVSLVEQLEKARQYKAAIAMYRVMSREGNTNTYTNITNNF